MTAIDQKENDFKSPVIEGRYAKSGSGESDLRVQSREYRAECTEKRAESRVNEQVRAESRVQRVECVN